ncbi:MAG TPA: HD domain-containing protein [Firmicutes bacterium]|nr:HD domain-containing protein [Bacillota bacterium]
MWSGQSLIQSGGWEAGRIGLEDKIVTLEVVKGNPLVDALINRGNSHLGAIGYTEHGARHANLVASIGRNILLRLSFPEREAELAAIAGYLHDIGNVVSRHYHAQTGGVMAAHILYEMGMPADEIATVIGAIGSHDPEGTSEPVNYVSAAVILGDKSDVHRSRVRNTDKTKFDIHDRVNYAVERSFLKVDEKGKTITLELKIDTAISPVMDYFEIFLARMIMCRKAATFLGCNFELRINDTRLL